MSFPGGDQYGQGGNRQPNYYWQNFQPYLVILLNIAAFVLILFDIIGGVTTTPPLSSIFFLEADTSGIGGARQVTRWHFFKICGAGENGNSIDCSASGMAPLGAWNQNAYRLPAQVGGPGDGGTVNNNLYGAWVAAWWMTMIGFVVLFFKIGDACTDNFFSNNHRHLGKVVQFFPLIIFTPSFALIMYVGVPPLELLIFGGLIFFSSSFFLLVAITNQPPCVFFFFLIHR